ncbi:Protein of unknown function (DUF3421) [Popillia japonica]|uniref:Uncharacterized protein n=1 Tax=Popillia japonica TaxID=7064 RepID=A0AAW1KMC4_POPJA
MMKAHILCYLVNIFILTSGVTNHNYYWRDYWGRITPDAISFDGIYIAQAPEHGLLPGSLDTERNEITTEVFGRKIILRRGIKVLCDQNIESFHWDKISTNQLVKEYLEDAVVGGIESDSLLYIGRIFHEGVFKIGKVFPPSSPFSGFRGWYNFNDTQYKTDDFEILKYKSLPSPSKCQ